MSSGYDRTPIFTEEALIGDHGEAEVVKPPERSFWAKYVSVFAIPFYLTLKVCFLMLLKLCCHSVDVLDPSWPCRHECDDPSHECG